MSKLDARLQARLAHWRAELEQLRRARSVESFEDHQVAVTQARIVAKETDKASEQFEDHACS